MKPGPKPLLGTAMTHAERQTRYRTSHAGDNPRVVYRRLPTIGAGHSGGVMRLPN